MCWRSRSVWAGHAGRKVWCQSYEGGPVHGWDSAGEAAVARVETMAQPAKSGVSSHVFREQWKNTEIYSNILL